MSVKKSSLLQGVFLNFLGEISGVIRSMFANILFLGVTKHQFLQSPLLKQDQFRACDIISWHLEQTLAGENPKVVLGYSDSHRSLILVKAVYTGVAPSLIDGKKTHMIIASLSMNSEGTLGDESKAKMQQFWHPGRYLIIDEFSMIAKTFLAILSKNIGIGKEAALSVVLMSYFVVMYINSHPLHNRVRSLVIGWWI
jgi:hypothetical protein